MAAMLLKKVDKGKWGKGKGIPSSPFPLFPFSPFPFRGSLRSLPVHKIRFPKLFRFFRILAARRETPILWRSHR
jgi:hypothetical protein